MNKAQEQAHSTFFRFYKRLFLSKRNQFSISNISQRLEHLPNFELECTVKDIKLSVDLVVRKEYWYFNTESNLLTYNNQLASTKDTEAFLSYFEYCLNKREEYYVTIKEY